MNELVLSSYENARQALAEARRIDQVKDIRDKAEAMRLYALQANDRDLLVWAAEIKLRAERRAGQMLTEMELLTGRPEKGSQAATISNLGITKSQSSRWQQEAKLSEKAFQDWLEDFKFKEDDSFPTSHGLRSLVDRLVMDEGQESEDRSQSETESRVYFGRPLIGDSEKRAVMEALSQRQLTNGGLVEQFEERFQEFTGGGLAVAVSSCTAALHIACMMHFRPGDQVILPALTHVSTAHAIEATGASPVFVDVCPETGNMTPEGVSEAVTYLTKGIIAVHYLGRPCDMAGIMSVARDSGLIVIEDCALALGASVSETHVGLLGDVGCFSFYPVKHITTGEGGMLLTKHSEKGIDAKRRRSFGQAKRYGDVEVFGLNYRMTEVQAALGLEQLKRLPRFLKKRQANYITLVSNLADLEKIDSSVGAFYGLSVFFPEGRERDEVLHELRRRSIEASVYYPRLVPHLSYYRGRYGDDDYPNAERISSRTICLPVGPHLGKRHIRYMIQAVREVLC